MSRRPTRGPVFGLLAVAGLVAVVASAQPWWRAQADGADVAFTGSDTTGGLSQALAVVLLVGTLLALTVGVVGRRILAVLLTVTAVGIALVGGLRLQPSPEAVRTRVRQVTLADQFDLVGTAWPWVFLGAGVLAVAGAGLLGWAAGRWPRRTARFDRRRTTDPTLAPTAASATVEAYDPVDDPAAAWRALDDGVDPTADPGPEADPASDPDVRDPTSGATMGGTPGTQPPS